MPIYLPESTQTSTESLTPRQIVAELDVLASFAEAAAKEGYVRPQLTKDFALEITAGRHPVVERMMARLESETAAAEALRRTA